MGSKNYLPWNSLVNDKFLEVYEKAASASKTKHNYKRSKAFSMPFSLWNLFGHKSDNY